MPKPNVIAPFSQSELPQQEADASLQYYWHLLIKHRRLIAIGVMGGLAVAAVVSFLSTPIYRATVLLNVDREKVSPFDIGTGQAVYSYDPEFIPTQTRLMTSREVAQRVARKLSLPGLPGAIDVRAVRGTNLIELGYIAASPDLAAQIANSLAETYIDWNLESKYELVGQASRFLVAQIEQLKTETDQKEQQLQLYGRQKDIISLDPASNVTMQKLESLNREYGDAVSDRVTKESRFQEVQTTKPDAVADTLSGGLVSQLRNDVLILERDYAEKLNIYKPEWPAMQQLKSQIERGRQNLGVVVQETVSKARELARSEYLAALRREESFKQILRAQRSEAMTLKINEVEYNNLRVEVATKRALLDTLLKRHAETELTSRLRGERISNLRIVERAVAPGAFFRPSYRRNAALGLLMGIAVGVGLAFLLEYLDRSLRSSEQVENYLRLPSLGIIPALDSPLGRTYGYAGKKAGDKNLDQEHAVIDLLPHTQPRSVVSEAYRAFRASLLLSQAGGIRSVVVTSSVAGEGKSATVVNLAVVLSQLGKRVLIVDGDLHKPRIHEIFHVTNRAGLVSFLVDGARPTDILIKTKLEGISVLTTGPLSPNPSGLLASDLMASLVSYGTDNFDYVIIDSPPLAAVADALILGQIVDGVVLCVKGGKTPRELVASARDRLLRSGIQVLGVLINNLDQPVPGDHAYYNYSGSYYGKTYESPAKITSAGGGA